jgi:hypothetical protein
MIKVRESRVEYVIYCILCVLSCGGVFLLRVFHSQCIRQAFQDENNVASLLEKK